MDFYYKNFIYCEYDCDPNHYSFLLKGEYRRTCLVCGFQSNFPHFIDDHIKLKMHQENVKKNPYYVPHIKQIELFVFYCDVCNVKLMKESVVDHLLTADHKSKAILRRDNEKFVEKLKRKVFEPAPDYPEMNKLVWNGIVPDRFYCALCEHPWSCLKTHIESLAHRTRVNQWKVKLFPFANYFLYYRPYPSQKFQCLQCHAVLNMVQLTDHYIINNHPVHPLTPGKGKIAVRDISKSGGNVAGAESAVAESAVASTSGANVSGASIRNDDTKYAGTSRGKHAVARGLRVADGFIRKLVGASSRKSAITGGGKDTSACEGNIASASRAHIAGTSEEKVADANETVIGGAIRKRIVLRPENSVDENEEEAGKIANIIITREFIENLIVDTVKYFGGDSGDSRLGVRGFIKRYHILPTVAGLFYFCALCRTSVGFTKEDVIGHVKELFHIRASRFEHERVKVKPLFEHAKEIMYSESKEMVVINNCILIDIMTYTYCEKIKLSGSLHKYKCHLCDVILHTKLELINHCQSLEDHSHELHVESFVLVLDDCREFVREVRPSLLQCGYCKIYTKGWIEMRDHLKTPEHHEEKNKKTKYLNSIRGEFKVVEDMPTLESTEYVKRNYIPDTGMYGSVYLYQIHSLKARYKNVLL